MAFLIPWYIITIVQSFFAYGTAYRFTKKGGDDGVALCGWSIVFGFASFVPGLGIYLWYKYKNDPKYNTNYYTYTPPPVLRFPIDYAGKAEESEETMPCPFCGKQISKGQAYCQYCGGMVGPKI